MRGAPRANAHEITLCFIPSNLLNEAALESDVFARPVRKRHGHDVGESLGLVDDGVSEG